MQKDIMTIYIDIIFLENLFMNYIILFATGIILKTKFKIIRTCISSIIGALYAILMYIYEMEIYSNFCLKILLSLVIVETAFNPKTLKLFLKYLIIFYLTSFTFGGVAFALIYFINPSRVIFSNGKLIGIYPIKMILLGGILGFIIIVVSFKNIKKKLTKSDMFCDIEICINGNSKCLTSIIDTGNFLRDPISKAPVIIISKESLRNILPDELLDNIKEIVMGDDINLGEYIERIRLIPFSSLGRENGLLLGVKPDMVLVDYQDSIIYINNAIIGISTRTLNKENKYQALIGLEAIESRGGIINEHFENIEI